jgi:DNA-directed RNA polymerase
MSLVIRDTFIALHQSDVLKRLDDEVRMTMLPCAPHLTRLQIRERYKGYKLPTTQARAPGFERALSAYRSSVLSSAAALKTQDAALAVAVDESGQEAGVLEAAALEDAAAAPVRDDALSVAVDALKAEVVDAAAASPEELTDVAADASVDLFDGAPVDGGAEDAHAGLLSTRFVDLVDILPPLPNKGDFDVSKIKNSQYFFS